MQGAPVETLERSGEPESAEADEAGPEVTVAELLVEEVSIDGMCGVY